MKIRIAVCEREIQTREYLIANLKELSGEVVCVEYDNVYDLVEQIEMDASAYDVICVSATTLKKGDGIAAAAKIRSYSLNVAIIIMADSKDYYAEAFDMFAMAYLIKPVQYQAIERCFTFYTKNNKADRRSSWMVKSRGGNWKRIFCRDIVYIESNNREFVVHLADGENIESYGKLADVVEQLASDSLIRCHQSYIVNMYYISEMKTANFMMDDIVIPISRKYQKSVKDQYYKYMFNRM
ncbi:LytR/AlgR family response regulator transcription factor [Hespellia stercorisuis]|uniref:Stage 0 sporulation protein A homolog n=1 Tax=Hespellia stercorisuis DSM 15480 TaxID=1121950 RepID=A0A1M6R155_9FIRM|nr:LytTR family DNA-binding domain-containing protein [Hespellia stercorisuis]SHK26221.1 two component transcriptional regulator, LytTR family [Hespellia stercorisuis DSM 15480]